MYFYVFLSPHFFIKGKYATYSTSQSTKSQVEWASFFSNFFSLELLVNIKYLKYYKLLIDPVLRNKSHKNH